VSGPRWAYWADTGEWMLAAWSPAGEPTDVFGSASASSLTAIPPAVRRLVQDRMQDQHGTLPPAGVFDGPPDARLTMTCGACWAVSYDREAASSRRCPTCGVAEGDVPAPALRLPRQRIADDQPDAEGAEAER
jgi:hypothetical protein